MSKITNEQVDMLASIFKSLKKKIDMSIYNDLIPDGILEKIDKAPSVEEFILMNNMNDADNNIKDIMPLFQKAYNTIKFEIDYLRRQKYLGSNNERIKRIGDFEVFWKSVVKLNKHMQILEHISAKTNTGNPKSPPNFRVKGCVSEYICDSLAKADLITIELIEFLTSENGKRYFNVGSKEKVIYYLHINNRYDDMYRFYDNGSKMIDDLVIKFARKDDLPFLLGTDGKTAKKRIEKRMDKGK